MISLWALINSVKASQNPTTVERNPELIHLRDGKSMAHVPQLLFAPMAGIINGSQHFFLVSQDTALGSLSM